MREGARVIISASGMMTGGRVLHHALRMVPDPEATIVFVGFQAAGTIGRRIQDGEPEVKIMNSGFRSVVVWRRSAVSPRTRIGKKFCVGSKGWKTVSRAKPF